MVCAELLNSLLCRLVKGVSLRVLVKAESTVRYMISKQEFEQQMLALGAQLLQVGNTGTADMAQTTLSPIYALLNIVPCHDAYCMVQAMEDVHHAGLAHMDVTPANIMVDQVDNLVSLKIVDFGLSNHIRPGACTTTLCS